MEVSKVRTNIVLDDKLVKEGLKLTRLRTKKDLVNLALRELIERRKRKRILKLEGKVGWEGSLDEMRRSRLDTG
jgi:Arc/MetJ family transcription regulator